MDTGPARDDPGAQADRGSALVAAAARAADKADAAVPAADEPANQVLVDNARLIRWTAPLFVVCALILVPWIIILGTTLPQRQLSEHYGLAWTGYDAMLVLGLVLTGYYALRRSSRLPIAAAATGALLTADAWFDVLTTPRGHGLVEAIAMSVLAELPLAFVCFWLAVHSQDIMQQRIVMLLGRRP